jgi:UDP-arabinose 4-epimerase
MRVLVTGGAGYIGSHAAKALANAGHQPVVYDNLSRGHAWAVKWGPLVRGDIGDFELLKQTLQEHRIQAIMHFAASAYVGESMIEPGAYFDNNSVKSLRLLEAARQVQVPHFIFSSTCATYGRPQTLPIREDHPQCPINPYGESKLFVEKMLRWYGDVHHMNWVSLRYFNAAGADPDGETGESHDPETHLIPLMIEAAANQQNPILVFGTDYPTIDGTAVRDYVHVSDLAEAHVRALQYLDDGGRSLAFNLGTGKGHSIREIGSMVTRLLGATPAIQEVGRRAGDPECLIADPSLALATLQWHPKLSDLQSIVGTAVEWSKRNLVRYIRVEPTMEIPSVRALAARSY